MSGDFYRIGATLVYTVSLGGEYGGGFPIDITPLFYPVPGRFLGTEFCFQWRYGTFGDYGQAAIDDGYGIDPFEEAPSWPPEGVEQAEWDDLTNAERLLILKYLSIYGQDQLIGFVAVMRLVRNNAFEWAALHEPQGENDGRQDALRHAYWQCTMVKTFDWDTAVQWGWAHEQGNTNAARGRMDLFNNAVGRRVATRTNDCESGVLEASRSGLLQEDINRPLPDQWQPSVPPPPPPPIDQ